jgi:hypothetical protein
LSERVALANSVNDVDALPRQDESTLQERESDEDEEAGLGGPPGHGHINIGLTLEDLQSQFGVGSREAARNLGVSITTLKRCCRKNGIMRWPRRELAKLQKAINSVGMVGGCALTQRVLGPTMAPAVVAPTQPTERTLDVDPSKESKRELNQDKISDMEQDAMHILFSLNNNTTASP